MIPSPLLLITSFFLFRTNYLHLPLYTSCFISMFLNEDIVDIKTPDGIYSPIFVVGELSGHFLYPSVFFIKNSRSA